MKYKLFSILVTVGILISGCNENKKSDVTVNQSTPDAISGRVEGGYRHIPLVMSSDSTKVTVYRGDYIKFHLDDQGNPQSDYELSIPDMAITSMLNDKSADLPYFKMKNTGKFAFRLGTLPGTIEVVELRQANYRELSAEEAWKLTLKNPPFILDVRTQAEYNRGYLKDAVLIPLQDLQNRLSELERYKNQPILVYCATGNRSTTASKLLLDKGFKDVMNLRMGIMGWGSKGYNIEFQ